MNCSTPYFLVWGSTCWWSWKNPTWHAPARPPCPPTPWAPPPTAAPSFFTFSRLGLRSLLRCRNPPLTPVPWSRSQLWWVRQCGGVRVRARVLCVGRRHARWPTEDQLATAFFCLLRNIRSACKVEKIYTTLPGVQCQTGTRYPTR